MYVIYFFCVIILYELFLDFIWMVLRWLFLVNYGFIVIGEIGFCKVGEFYFEGLKCFFLKEENYEVK